MDISPAIVISKQRFKKITDHLPKSPISKKQQKLQPTSQIQSSNLHTDPTPVAITPHSQYYHTCNLCKVKNIPCVLIKEQETRHASDCSKAVIFKGFLIYCECATNL